MLIKFIIVLVLFIIIGSLFSALFFLMKNKGVDDDRTVKALTLRIGLSITLFLALIIAGYFGLIGHSL
ncbi:MAG TPA: twin transmembrane helix small protein [Methylotenera sp.]|nr:twin transmembrane helix small protein [Methylotenera sp.]HPH05357.1 twin transmembrane helix small protein [Methylotenera sp.]HPN01283.1 twin transmembrane helix small protein [Methylotenera sp.]